MSLRYLPLTVLLVLSIALASCQSDSESGAGSVPETKTPEDIADGEDETPAPPGEDGDDDSPPPGDGPPDDAGGEEGDDDPAGEMPVIALERVADGLGGVVDVRHAGDGSGRLFTVERRGVVRILEDGEVSEEPFLDLSATVEATGGEQGLLGIAFPPDYPERRHFYVVYTIPGNDVVLVRYELLPDSDIPDPDSAVTILTATKAQAFRNHNGGRAEFGPDGMLYLSLGDGGGQDDPLSQGQDPGTLFGTILRIDVEGAQDGTYAIPQDNPFVGDADARGEVWVYGLRNPWRFSFDRATGDLYIADVGERDREEINVQEASSQGGENYGWSVMEGSLCFMPSDCDPDGLVLPVTEYDHSDGDCSVTGGFVYRGEAYPDLQGVYLYGDFCSGRIRGLRRVGDEWEAQVLLESDLQMITTFAEDEDGNLYVSDFATGTLYRIVVP